MTKDFHISGMTCSGCAAKVIKCLEGSEDIRTVSIEAPFKGASIDFHRKQSVADLNELLKDYPQYVVSLVASAEAEIEQPSLLKTYQPLLVVFGFVLILSLVGQFNFGEWNGALFMRHFMASFFLLFSLFKILDVKGFAKAFKSYDVLAKLSPAYAFLYPFIELALSIAFFTQSNLVVPSAITLFIMLFGLIGVIRAVRSKQQIQCACLGTGFNLPMSTVTIIENSLMAVMAGAMLIKAFI